MGIVAFDLLGCTIARHHHKANCIGTAKSYNSNFLLSNKLKSSTAAGITEIYIGNEDDEVVGYFDLMGRIIDSNIKNQLVITRYKSGRIEKEIK